MHRIALFALLIVGGLLAATAEAAPRTQVRVQSPGFNFYYAPRPYYVQPVYPYLSNPYSPYYPYNFYYYRPYQPGFQFYYQR